MRIDPQGYTDLLFGAYHLGVASSIERSAHRDGRAGNCTLA